MSFNTFTTRVQEAVQTARQIAQQYGHQELQCEHLFKAVEQVDESVLPFLSKKLNTSREQLSKNLEAVLRSFPKVTEGSVGISREANTMLNEATNIAKKWNDEYVLLEHLLLAIFKSNSKIAQALKDRGVSEKEMEKAIQELRRGERVTSASAEDIYNSFNKYAKNLNQLADSGELDPVIGCDEGIRHVLQILSRRTKNNPMLIGEPGVGKITIAEGLAHRTVKSDVPENLKDKVIYSLDMGTLTAGAKYKGEFEERFESVAKEVTSSDGSIILFIDEIHTLVGAGGGEGATDAANILKPALARGKLCAIGAITLDEYQEHFEKDKALERRFQKVMVGESDTESVISILRDIKEKYETHHKVCIKDEATIAAVEFSECHITNRFLPDKAIDLMDEAAAKLRMEINSKPEELDIPDREIMQLEIEIEAIKRKNDETKLKIPNIDLANLREERNAIYAKWQGEKDVIDEVQATKEAIEQYKLEASRAEREGDYGRVTELRYGRIKGAEAKLVALQENLDNKSEGNSLVRGEVTAEDIAEVAAKWTDIPVSRMLQGEYEKLSELESELHKRVVGQEETIEAVLDVIRRSCVGLQNPRRPIGSFLFLGTTGIGKTELVKALAEHLFGDENTVTRIDMSEHQEKRAASRLVGAPPGYVGCEEDGQLTEVVCYCPYSVIPLDEIEKAHPDTFNILLQVLDEGRLTDNKGRIAGFKNTIITMTSNMGSQLIQEAFDKYVNDTERVIETSKNEVLQLLKQTVRPEFLSRIDDIIMFTPLNANNIRSTVRLQLDVVIKMVVKEGILMDATDEAIDHLVQKGFDSQFGVRPVKRIIQKEMLNRLSKETLSGNIHEDSTILLDAFDGELVSRN